MKINKGRSAETGERGSSEEVERRQLNEGQTEGE